MMMMMFGYFYRELLKRLKEIMLKKIKRDMHKPEYVLENEAKTIWDFKK